MCTVIIGNKADLYREREVEFDVVSSWAHKEKSKCIWFLHVRKSCVQATDIEEGDTRPCAILIPAWSSNWGSLGFPVIRIIVVRQVRKLIACTAG